MSLPQNIRGHFPIFGHRRKLIYLDSAATAQKPAVVLEAMDRFYRNDYGSVHRGVHDASESATAAYENARATTARFLNAAHRDEIIFTCGTTESINLVARSWGAANLKRRDVVVLTEMEHHANLVPWYLLAEERDLELRFVRIHSDGTLDLEDLAAQLADAKLLSLTHVSNVLGTINPIVEITAMAHAAGAKVLLDAAQSVPNMPVDVQTLDVDWLAFSAHKAFGPTGIGMLYGKREILAGMPPFLGGGQMIREVDFEEATYAEPPYRFEAGTMPVAEAVGLGAALDYLSKLGLATVHQHETSLTALALDRLLGTKGVTVYGTQESDKRGGLVSFTVENIHAHDLATILNEEGVAIRSGHHCAQPLHKKLGVAATARASFSIYNTADDVEALIAAINKAKQVFA